MVDVGYCLRVYDIDKEFGSTTLQDFRSRQVNFKNLDKAGQWQNIAQGSISAIPKHRSGFVIIIFHLSFGVRNFFSARILHVNVIIFGHVLNIVYYRIFFSFFSIPIYVKLDPQIMCIA